MEGGPSSSSTTSYSMMGFGDNNNGLSSMVVMMPFMMNSSGETSNKMFIPSTCLNNNNNFSNQRSGSSSSGQRVATTTFMPQDNTTSYHNINTGFNCLDSNNTSAAMRSKIMAHPHFPRLLAAYVNCQKVGAPPEVVARLETCASEAGIGRSSLTSACLGEDPALDQFMEAYCEMLAKYEQEITKPFKEAMLFLSRTECQFKALTLSSSSSSYSACDDFGGRNGSFGEEVEVNDSYIDPQAEDRELKGQLLQKYSGYLGSLKQEFMKKRKKGKLPKEARQQLLDWWNRHYKWPYPSESQKLALAESTGLDQKQINNWFINQRKRHWKPSEDMQFVVMDAAYPQYYMDSSVMGNSFPMDCTPSHL